MICRIYEFMMENNLQLPNDATVHAKDCRFDECKESGKCECFDNLEERLTKTNYSWTLSHRVDLLKAQHLLSKPYADGIISLRLIHPVQDTIWVTYLEDGTYVFSMSGKPKQCISLKEVNYQLKSMNVYDGRDLTVEDFKLDD